MSFIQREHDRLMVFCTQTPPGPAYEALYAAKQALAWALDPLYVASPTMQVKRHYGLEIEGTEGIGAAVGGPVPVGAPSPPPN
jgi:hypothetical protein